MEFLSSIKEIFAKNNICTSTQPKLVSGIADIKYCGNGHVRKIAKFLYKDATIFLDRKHALVKHYL
jgi:hypothetical protein